jgi:hypothetical protein
MYTIFLGDQTIGLVGLSVWDQVHYMIDPDQWGKGYATEALTAFLIALFELQSKRLSISTLITSDNVASRKVLEKCGFVPMRPPGPVGRPTSAEISMREELRNLEGIVDAHSSEHSSLGSLFFRYVKPAKHAV